MNKAVARIVGAAAIHALPLGLAPGRSGTNLVDAAHVSGVLLVVESLGIFSSIFFGLSLEIREPEATVSAAIA
jgi:hypothetical protein